MSGGSRCFAGGCSLGMILIFKEYQGDWFECVIRDGVQTMYNQYCLNADIDRSGEQVLFASIFISTFRSDMVLIV